jgi:hypothetical protein
LEGPYGVKEDFFSRGFFKIGNGQRTRFWEDVWLGELPLAQQYPSLYNLVLRKNVLVAEVLTGNPLNIGFRRTLLGNNWDMWLVLVQRLMMARLTDDPDNFVWKLTTSGLFTVKSMYADLMNGHMVFLSKYIWKLKVPLEVKIIMWFLYHKVILTKDNLAKINWNGCKNVRFVTLRSLSIIYFSIVPLISLFGEQFSLLSISPL